MKQGGGKLKGTKFERKLCQVFSLWWTKGIRKDLFNRLGSSGAKSTITNSPFLAGDMVQVEDKRFLKFPFCTEFKHYNKYDLYDLLDPDKKKNKILKWLDQCIESSERAKKEPMLVMKRDYFDELVIIKHYSRAKQWYALLDCGPRINFNHKECGYTIIKLKTLLKINPKEFYES